MKYKINKIKEINKRKYQIANFASEFSVDNDGNMYTYTTDTTITRLGINKTVEDFHLPGIHQAYALTHPRLCPVILDKYIFHVRYEKKGSFVLITDICDMKELTRIYLPRDPFVRKVFKHDNHVFIAAEYLNENKYVLYKLSVEGEIVWEYQPSEGTLSTRDVVSLHDRKILAPVSTNDKFSITKCYLVDNDKSEVAVVKDIDLPYSHLPLVKSEVLSDRNGNICIFTGYTGIYENDQITEPFKFNVVVLEPDGNECFRNTISLNVFEPNLYYNQKYVISSNFMDARVIKTDLSNGSQTIIIDSQDHKWILKACSSENGTVLCRSDDKITDIYFLNSSDDIVCSTQTKGMVWFLELKNNYLYYVANDRFGIYNIMEYHVDEDNSTLSINTK